MNMIDALKNRMMNTSGATISPDEVEFLQAEVERCVNAIIRAEDLSEAEPQLRRLGEVQEVLAAAWFKHGLEISELQKSLVRNYDRPDDADLREHVFWEIRSHRFLNR